MKKGVFTAIGLLWLMTALPASAEGHWRYYRYENFPKFSLSVRGGLTLYDGYTYDEFGEYRDTAFSHAMAGVSGHLWVHPNFSVDLGLSAHILTNYMNDTGWGYVSIKPGVRARISIFYFRTALDLSMGSTNQKAPVLFGFLVGAGINFPIAPQIHFFSEINYQYIYFDYDYTPLSLQAGIEFIF